MESLACVTTKIPTTFLSTTIRVTNTFSKSTVRYRALQWGSIGNLTDNESGKSPSAQAILCIPSWEENLLKGSNSKNLKPTEFGNHLDQGHTPANNRNDHLCE